MWLGVIGFLLLEMSAGRKVRTAGTTAMECLLIEETLWWGVGSRALVVVNEESQSRGNSLA